MYTTVITYYLKKKKSKCSIVFSSSCHLRELRLPLVCGGWELVYSWIPHNVSQRVKLYDVSLLFPLR